MSLKSILLIISFLSLPGFAEKCKLDAFHGSLLMKNEAELKKKEVEAILQHIKSAQKPVPPQECGQSSKTCGDVVRGLTSLDKDWSNVKIFKGIFDLDKQYLGNMTGMDGIPTPVNLPPSERLCPRVYDKEFTNIQDFINFLFQNEKGYAVGLFPFIQRCLNSSDLPLEQQKNLAMKLFVAFQKINATLMSEVMTLSQINMELQPTGIEDLCRNNVCIGFSGISKAQCEAALTCPLSKVNEKSLAAKFEEDIKSGLSVKKSFEKQVYQRWLKDGPPYIGLDAMNRLHRYTSELNIIASRWLPEFDQIKTSETLEENLIRIKKNKAKLKKNIEAHIEEIKVLDNCLRGFETDSKKCNIGSIFETLRNMTNLKGVDPSSIQPYNDSNRSEKKRRSVIQEYIGREDCLYSAKYEQMNVNDLIGKSIQDAVAVVFPPIAKLAFGKFSSAAGVFSAITRNGIKMAEWIPAVDGAISTILTCQSSALEKLRSQSSGKREKVHIDPSSCSSVEMDFRTDYAKCYRDAVFAIAGMPVIPKAVEKGFALTKLPKRTQELGSATGSVSIVVYDASTFVELSNNQVSNEKKAIKEDSMEAVPSTRPLTLPMTDKK